MTASVIAPTDETKAVRHREDAFGGTRLLNELLIASGRHDEAAFARFYQLTSPWLYHLLRHRTGSTTQAEDAMRVAYSTIWRRAANFTPRKQSALAWATTIACDAVAS